MADELFAINSPAHPGLLYVPASEGDQASIRDDNLTDAWARDMGLRPQLTDPTNGRMASDFPDLGPVLDRWLPPLARAEFARLRMRDNKRMSELMNAACLTQEWQAYMAQRPALGRIHDDDDKHSRASSQVPEELRSRFRMLLGLPWDLPPSGITDADELREWMSEDPRRFMPDTRREAQLQRWAAQQWWPRRWRDRASMACCTGLEFVQAAFGHSVEACVGWMLEDWREAVLAEDIRLTQGQVQSAQLRAWAAQMFLSLNQGFPCSAWMTRLNLLAVKLGLFQAIGWGGSQLGSAQQLQSVLSLIPAFGWLCYVAPREAQQAGVLYYLLAAAPLAETELSGVCSKVPAYEPVMAAVHAYLVSQRPAKPDPRQEEARGALAHQMLVRLLQLVRRWEPAQHSAPIDRSQTPGLVLDFIRTAVGKLVQTRDTMPVLVELMNEIATKDRLRKRQVDLWHRVAMSAVDLIYWDPQLDVAGSGLLQALRRGRDEYVPAVERCCVEVVLLRTLLATLRQNPPLVHQGRRVPGPGEQGLAEDRRITLLKQDELPWILPALFQELLAAKHAGRTAHEEACVLGLLELYRELAATPEDRTGWDVLRADPQGHSEIIRAMVQRQKKLGLPAAVLADLQTVQRSLQSSSSSGNKNKNTLPCPVSRPTPASLAHHARRTATQHQAQLKRVLNAHLGLFVQDGQLVRLRAYFGRLRADALAAQAEWAEQPGSLSWYGCQRGATANAHDDNGEDGREPGDEEERKQDVRHNELERGTPLCGCPGGGAAAERAQKQKQKQQQQQHVHHDHGGGGVCQCKHKKQEQQQQQPQQKKVSASPSGVSGSHSSPKSGVIEDDKGWGAVLPAHITGAAPGAGGGGAKKANNSKSKKKNKNKKK